MAAIQLRGRVAGIAAMVVGAIAVVVGLLMGPEYAVVAGGGGLILVGLVVAITG